MESTMNVHAPSSTLLLVIWSALALNLSCAQASPSAKPGETMTFKPWSFRELPHNLPTGTPGPEEQNLIASIKAAYASQPHDDRYRELVFQKMLRDAPQAREYFVFDIAHVDDISAVFVVSGGNREVVDNFLASDWQ
jgi:hypothetical protein